MAIKIKGKEISSIKIKNKLITIVRVGKRIVWEAINSCFGRGYWIDDKPWNDNDMYKNE